MSEKEVKDTTDGDLADLLSSTLADFSTASGDAPKPDTNDTKKEDAVVPVTGEGEEWSDDFIRQAAQQFESNIAALLSGTGGDAGEDALTPEQVQASFQRMAEAAQAALTNPGIENPQSNEFASTISQTIQGLSQGAENLQNPFNEADIMNMFGNLGGQGEQNAFLPFMQGMMQSLLSKEVLYPSLKDILSKYPDWLKNNEATLSAEDKERYIKQQELMQKVCEELEGEKDEDSAEVKKERFDKVLALMQTLQDHGQPPTDIVADAGPTVPFDQAGNPEQCCIV